MCMESPLYFFEEKGKGEGGEGTHPPLFLDVHTHSVQLNQWAAIVVDITFTSRKRRSCLETQDIVRRKCEEKRPPFSVLSVFVVIFVADTFSTQNYSLNTSLQIQECRN